MNYSFIQIQGPFKKNQDIVSYIKKTINNDFKYIKKIGIQTETKNYVSINNKIFEIGKTGILEFDNVQINSLFFMQDEQSTTLIDCVLE
jgi:hypothetical protein